MKKFNSSRLDQPRSRGLQFKNPYDSERFGLVSERVARQIGSWRFIALMTVFVAGWVLWNTLGPLQYRFDPWPFLALTLMLSLQASYAAPLILLAQNRQTDRDRVQGAQDRNQANRLLADTEFLARELADLRIALNDVATRDYIKSELRDLIEELQINQDKKRLTSTVSLTKDTVMTALATVQDPEIRRSITEIGMVKNVEVTGQEVLVEIYLTVSGCPLKEEIIKRVTKAVAEIDNSAKTKVLLDVMNDDQRKKLKELLRGPTKENPFAAEKSLTRIYAVASGKGGVGKSSLTANLGIAFAELGLSVGILDADIYGHSIPRIMGVTNAPTVVEGMIMPQLAHGVRVISMLAFKPGGVTQPIAFRGPMLHKAVEQFMTDVWWGDLDILLLDLPPGTGDVAISVAQLVPKSEIIVVTTPQISAAEVSVRAGTLAKQTHQRVVGVIENMTGVPCPHCGEVMELFGKGGGDTVAKAISDELGTDVKVLARVPFDVRLREGGDSGMPLVISNPDSPAAVEIINMAKSLLTSPKGLVGKNLGLLTN